MQPSIASSLAPESSPQPRWAEVPSVCGTLRAWVWEEPTRHRVLSASTDEVVYTDHWRGVAGGVELRLRTDLDVIVVFGSVDAATAEVIREAWLWRHRARAGINLARIEAARAEARNQLASFESACQLAAMALDECARRG